MELPIVSDTQTTKSLLIIDNINDFKIKIKNKLRDFRRIDNKIINCDILQLNKDLTTLKLQDGINLVNNLVNDICIGCGCTILFCNYKPWCVYQFSFDRIDNKKIHCIDNLRIVCYNCNSSGYGSKKLSCSRYCHISEEDIHIRRDLPYKKNRIKYPFRFTEEIFNKYKKWALGINYKTNKKIQIGGKMHIAIKNSICNEYDIYGTFNSLQNINMDNYFIETEQIYKKIDNTNSDIDVYNTMIDNIIEQISKLNTLGDYIEFEGKRYGKSDNSISINTTHSYMSLNNIF